MSSPKHERDSDRESLTGWTLVDREGTPDKTTHGGAVKDDDKDSGESSSSPASAGDKEVDKRKNESGCGKEEEEELSEDLISMGKRVQEIKAPSGSDSSDIETLDCPGPDDCYEDSTQGYSSLHSSLLSSLSGFTFVGEADEGDVESLASSDVMVLDQEGKGVDEETDLSLASSPSLPDDLPAIKPDTQYRHTPDRNLNSRLNVVVALTLACVLGLGLGHFLGWSSRSLWQENLNSAQVRRLRELQDDLLSCINSPHHVEPEAGGPEYLPATTFIPVLTEAEAEGASNVETFVESLVVPLEEAGVVLGPGQKQQQQQNQPHHHYHRPGHSDSMEPTFATLDLLYGSSDPSPVMGQEQEARIHSGLSEPPLISDMAEDEVELPLPHLALPVKTVEPTFNEEETLYPSVSPTNTLPPIELDSGHENIPEEEPWQPLLHSAGVMEGAEAPSVAVENSQIIEALNLESEELRSEITRLQENVSPIKISGKDGKNARNLRERITQLLVDNEELRVAVARQQFAGLPEGDTKAFNKVLGTNYKLRLSVGKLSHLVPDLTALKVSANDLEKENQELQQQVGKLRYQEQPLPQELNVVAREVESLKKVVDEASKKKKAPPNFENAKIYLNYMSQVLQTLHDFKEGGLVEKLDVATDVFEGLVSGNVKPSASVQHKLNAVRLLFKQLKSSLASKWEKIKDLSRPQHLAQVSQDTLSKMNRVIVNVVNKMKDIGQASIMKRGKASLENTAATLAQSLAALSDQFDKTWRNLEAEVGSDGEEESSELLIAEDEEVQEGEKAIAVDDGEGEAKEKKPQDARDEASENKNLSPNKSKKGDGKSGGTGGGGKGGGGGRKDGGDGKKELEGKKTRKESAEKKKEDKHDGRRDRSRRSRMSDKEEKKEEEKKKKKTKEEEEKAKKKKEKENKKPKKEKEDNMNKKSKDKEDFSHKKENDWSRKSLQQDDKRYHKGHYNKYDKKQHRFDNDDDEEEDDSDDTSDDDHDGKFKRKLHKMKQIRDDTVDDDDDIDDGDEEDKKKGLIRHWEKPSRKNYRREFPGPKKAFIRRRGKNATVHPVNQDREWVGRRATGREVKRKEEQRADWLFERAKHRSHKRKAEHKADWQFERARGRKDRRIEVGAEEQGHRQSRDDERFGHNKYEKLQAKRRYVRFDDDDDDDDDDNDDDDDFDSDYEFYNHHHHNHHHHYNQDRGRGEYKHHSNKGKREWVIPNFSATGKTYYH